MHISPDTFAQVQHFIHYFGPQNMPGLILSDGRLSSIQSGELEIRATFQQNLSKSSYASIAS